MEWKVQFVVYRLTTGKEVEEVFHSNDFKKAKYWIQYIAQPGDVLCKTPIHPKHSKTSGQAEYFCHKAASGKQSNSIDEWQSALKSEERSLEFPLEQLREPLEK